LLGIASIFAIPPQIQAGIRIQLLHYGNNYLNLTVNYLVSFKDIIYFKWVLISFVVDFGSFVEKVVNLTF